MQNSRAILLSMDQTDLGGIVVLMITVRVAGGERCCRHFQWLKSQRWHYRLRLKGNLIFDPGFDDETTAGKVVRDAAERLPAKCTLIWIR